MSAEPFAPTGRAPERPREVVLLGATGSIGTQAVDVVLQRPERFRVTALAAGGGRPALLAEQAVRLGVRTVAVADEAAADAVHRALKEAAADGVELLSGPGAVEHVAGLPCDVVLNGMTGAVGLAPTLATLRAGSRLALANKESLIVGGPLVKALSAEGQIVPVDSEHSALAQALRGGSPDEVARLVVTASGGPFRGRSRDELVGVTAAEALAHPTWSMGPVITTNSATLVNKGLEVIEAHLLFDLPFDRIAVVVHPQSIVHSMVEFVDGSILAQASPPDMRLPIALGLAWPHRVPGAVPACDFSRAQSWEFLPLDDEAFPAVRLARRCGERGGVHPAVYNAANEVGVAAFLEGRIGFLDIVDTVSAVVGELPERDRTLTSGGQALTLEDVLTADVWARERAAALLAGRGAPVRATKEGTA